MKRSNTITAIIAVLLLLLAIQPVRVTPTRAEASCMVPPGTRAGAIVHCPLDTLQQIPVPISTYPLYQALNKSQNPAPYTSQKINVTDIERNTLLLVVVASLVLYYLLKNASDNTTTVVRPKVAKKSGKKK